MSVFHETEHPASATGPEQRTFAYGPPPLPPLLLPLPLPLPLLLPLPLPLPLALPASNGAAGSLPSIPFGGP